jgi:hypothetical protein
MLRQISLNHVEHYRIRLDQRECSIALEAKQSSNNSSFMTVIDREPLFFIFLNSRCFRLLTKFAQPILGLVHFVVCLRGDAEFSFKMPFKFLSLSKINISFSPLSRRFTASFCILWPIFIKLFSIARIAQTFSSCVFLRVTNCLFPHGEIITQ